MNNVDNNIFCIIPAYNEENNIKRVISDLKKYITNIIVVDDGSEDDTFEISLNEEIHVLKHLTNRGQGAALQTGNDYALRLGAEIVVHFDADGQFLPEEIKEMVTPIIKGEAEAVFGSRFLEKKSNIPWMKEKMIMPLARLVNKYLLGVYLSDPQSGFRALSKKALNKIIIEQDGMAHCSEILYKTTKNDIKIKEVPITVIYKDFGQKFSGGIKIFKDLIIAKFL